MVFEQECLQAHNKYRQQHGMPLLKLNKEICKHSQQWADHLINQSTLEHSTTKNYGENIFCISSSDPKFAINGEDPVKSWYEEIKLYAFGAEPTSLAAGHFTQLVWKETKELGVGYAKKGGRIIVVANYSPPGNVSGRFTDNVAPVGGFDVQNNNNVAAALGTLARNVLPLGGPSKPSKKVEINKSIQTRRVDYERVLNPETMEYQLFINDVLKGHNDYRRKHGVPALKLNVKLSKFALEWAEHCSKVGLMVHRPNNSYGENIFCLYSSDCTHVPSARDVVKLWYDEIKDYKFDSEDVNHSTLHFTQLIWKGSKSVGIGMARNNKGQTYVVANYNPRGNIIGQFIANVPKPKS